MHGRRRKALAGYVRYPMTVLLLAAVLLVSACGATGENGTSIAERIDSSAWTLLTPSADAERIRSDYDTIVVEASGATPEALLQNSPKDTSELAGNRAESGMRLSAGMLRGCNEPGCLVVAPLFLVVGAAVGATVGLIEGNSANDRLQANAKLAEQAAQQSRSAARGINATLLKSLQDLVDASPAYALDIHFPGWKPPGASFQEGAADAGSAAKRVAVLRVGIDEVWLTRMDSLTSDAPTARLSLGASAEVVDQRTGTLRFRSHYRWASTPYTIEEWLADDAVQVHAQMKAGLGQLASDIAREHFYAQDYAFTLDLERMPGSKLVSDWAMGSHVETHGPRICWKPAKDLPPILELIDKADRETVRITYDLSLRRRFDRTIFYERKGLPESCHDIEDLDSLMVRFGIVSIQAYVRTRNAYLVLVDDFHHNVRRQLRLP